jgi:calreticulin
MLLLYHVCLVFVFLTFSCHARVYFTETFDDDGVVGEGVYEKWQTAEGSSGENMGDWGIVSSSIPFRFDIEVESSKLYTFPGESVHEQHLDRGLKTLNNFSYYRLSSMLTTPFYSKGTTLYLQFSLRLDQIDGLDCGGAYVKLFPGGLKPKELDGNTPYAFLFGPDLCGSTSQGTKIIIGYDSTQQPGMNVNRRNVRLQKKLHCEMDKATHLYTLIVRPDNTYEYHIDGLMSDHGTLGEHFEALLPPKLVSNSSAKKPKNWVDDPFTPEALDPTLKEANNQPKYIPDPTKQKPEKWNAEEDGVWEPPLIPNPRWRAGSEPRMVRNPKYKGPWKAGLVRNPEYSEERAKSLYQQCNPCEHIGFELWQVDAGTVFDDILITDSEDELMEETRRVQEKLAWERYTLSGKK